MDRSRKICRSMRRDLEVCRAGSACVKPSRKRLGILPLIASLAALSGCATAPPRNPSDVCAIFLEQPEWRDAAARAQRRWGIPAPILLAFVHQESTFRADARPPRPYLLGIVPWFRASSAYGYGQAKDETWRWYQEKTGAHDADRDNLSDTLDFIAWYCRQSVARLGLRENDAVNLYLAYHEGHAGFKRQTFRQRPVVLSVAKRVGDMARRYAHQLPACSAKRG